MTYNFYIWTAYSITAIVMFFLWINSVRQSRHTKKKLEQQKPDGSADEV